MEFKSQWCSVSLRTVAPHHVARLTLAGEIDLASTGVLHDALEAAAATGCPTVDLELADVTFLDLRSLGLVLRHRAALETEGRRLVLRNPAPIVATLLRAAGVVGTDDADTSLTATTTHCPTKDPEP